MKLILLLLLLQGCTAITINVYPQDTDGDYTLNLNIDDSDDVKQDAKASVY